jgi:D-methionine transport system ATP-binding protein
MPATPNAGIVPVQPQVQLRGINKVYSGAGAPALQDVALTIENGEVFGIIGRSGAGKSTLLRLINRLEVPSTGQVLIDGGDIAALNARQLQQLRRRVGMIFQNFNLVSVKTVWQNVAMPLLLAGRKGSDSDDKVREVLRLVGLEGKHDAYPAQLSGGQKQRVGIARALVNHPEILLCDEATSSLDPETTQSILELLREINCRLGLTIVLITHEMDVIRAICDRVLVLDHGRVAEQGRVWQVFGNPQHEVTRQLLHHEATRLPDEFQTRVRSIPVAGLPQEVLLRLRFTGQKRYDSDLLTLVQALGVPVHLHQARLESIQGRTVGEWLLGVTSPIDQLPSVLDQLGQFADGVDVIGYLEPQAIDSPSRSIDHKTHKHAPKYSFA